MIVEPTAEDVFAFRAEHGVGLMAAKKILMKRALVKATETAETPEDFRAIILELLELV